MRVLVLIAAVVGLTAAAQASGLEDAIARCAVQSSDAARLACYDAIAAQVKHATPAQTSPAPVTATPQEFGAENLSKENKEAAGQPVPLDEIHTTVTAISFTQYGRFTVTLANGQVWRQIDGDTGRARFNKKGSDKITISRGLFGSYNFVIDGHVGLFKVARVK